MKNKCWWRCGEIGTFVHCWLRNKMMKLLWKTVWLFLKKLNIKLPYDPVIPLLNVYPRKLKTGSQRDICILDEDPGQWDLCAVAAMDKFTWTTEILWRKGSAQLLYKWETGPRPPPWLAFIIFLGTLHQGWSSFTMHRFALGGYRKQRRGCC